MGNKLFSRQKTYCIYKGNYFLLITYYKQNAEHLQDPGSVHTITDLDPADPECDVSCGSGARLQAESGSKYP
jgi:hypothetical protein